jgi:hypothetical protein
MASSSVTAIQAKWNSLTAGLFPGATLPPLYFDYVPLRTTTGTDRRLPYGVLRDNGMTISHIFQNGAIEKSKVDIEIYAIGQADLDQIVLAVKYNGSPPSVAGGMDWAMLTLTPGQPRSVIKMMRVNERNQDGGFEYQERRVRKCTLSYILTTSVIAS